MVSQYPHRITIVSNPEFAQNEESGNFQQVPDTESTFESECRAEPAGSNPVIKGADGEDVVISWLVYMPKTEMEFSYGDKVLVTMQNGSQYEGTVKRQSNGQFNSRLWV